MDSRKQELLKLVIESYVDTADPVGSRFLVSNNDLKVSEATVRNEMRDLEQEGYLAQPHTSAGRIPTEKGYQFYIKNLLTPVAVKKKTTDEIKGLLRQAKAEDEKRQKKTLAVYVAERTHSAVIVVFGRDSFYYTGISYLFAQPEFRDTVRTVNVSRVFDHLEEHIDDVYDKMNKKDISVFVGKENPLGSDCGTVGAQSSGGELFLTLGPMRMNYAKHISMMSYIHESM